MIQPRLGIYVFISYGVMNMYIHLHKVQYLMIYYKIKQPSLCDNNVHVRTNVEWQICIYIHYDVGFYS